MNKILLTIVLCFAIQYLIAQEQEVTFKTDTLTLNGTLAVPAGNGPFPAIVLVHGSGPNSRDESIALTDANSACLFPGLYGDTVKTFADLSAAFVAEGYIVLRYDKRTLTHAASLNLKDITINDFIRDVHSALDFLRSHPMADNQRLILMGHSQGGNMINIVANERDDVAALVGLAAPSMAIDSAVAGQIRHIYTACGDSNFGKAQAAQLLAIFTQLRNGTWNMNTPIMGAYPAFWLDWIHKSDSSVAYYRTADVPALFIQGTDDYNVTPENAYRFQQQLGASADVYILPGINHFLTDSTHPEVAKEVSDTILYWLRNSPLSTIEKKRVRLQVLYDTVEGKIILRIPEGKDVQHLSVETLNGKSVNAEFQKTDGGYILSPQALKKGLYVVRGNIDGQPFAQKMLVQ
ncbi:MAG: alpha/beta fold hydrolase [Bacteroidia bacterium]